MSAATRDPSRARPTTCLVSMPFIPITMPSLGVSTLKATLRRRGLAVDVYYGALEFFRMFADAGAPTVTPILDYDYIALNSDVGDVFFSQVLWPDLPGTRARVDAVLDEMRDSPNPLFGRDDLVAMMTRVRGYVDRAGELIDRCYAARDWSRYDVVGFSSTFCQNVASLCLARKIRDNHPGVHIVFGGANCEGEMGRQLLRSFPWVDTVIQGEADESLPEFITRLGAGEDLAGVPGILYRADGRVRDGAAPEPVQDMDRVPVPDFTDFFEQLPPLFRGGLLRMSVPIETSRGCWWGAVSHCTFCGLNPTTMKFRAKSPARALDEFAELARDYGVAEFCAVDNIISRRYFDEVLPALADRGLSIFYETKSNLSEYEVYQLHRAGVASIQPGIESLNTEVLKLMRKGVKGHQNIALLKWCATYGVEPVWFMLYRFPYESHAAYYADIELLPRLAHLPPPKNPNPVLIDRYSPLFTRRDEFGLTRLRPVGRAEIYYAGLAASERFDITYHFEADLPQGQALPYELPLWQAVLAWRYAAARGARFYQFCGANTTLLIDSRREGDVRSYLLLGAAHTLHHALRRGRPLAAVLAALRAAEPAALTTEDFVLTHVAGTLAAEEVAAPVDEADLPRFLADLEARWIALHIDDRWLALATDCVHPQEVAPLGLAAFARSRDELALAAAADDARPTPAPARPPGLVQLSRATAP